MGEQLTPEQRTQLCAVLDRYPEVFDDRPGFTHVIEHKIEVMDQTPIYQRPYRIPESQRDVVERELLNMVQPGIIRYDTESLWSSPLVVVKKQDGSSRLVNNFINGPVVHLKNFKRLCMGGTKYSHVQYQIFSTIGCGLLQEFHCLVQQFKLNPMSCSA